MAINLDDFDGTNIAGFFKKLLCYPKLENVDEFNTFFLLINTRHGCYLLDSLKW